MKISLLKTFGILTIMSAVFVSPTSGREGPDDSDEISDLINQFNNNSLKDNPLIPYKAAANIKDKLCADPGDKTGFWQCYANFGAFIGDIKATMQAYAKVRAKQPANWTASKLECC